MPFLISSLLSPAPIALIMALSSIVNNSKELNSWVIAYGSLRYAARSLMGGAFSAP